MKLTEKAFGTNNERLYTIDNEQGISMSLTNYGARIVDLIVERNGKKQNLILGYQSADEYKEKDAYIGATIGRVAGRLTDSQFYLEDKKYTVASNENNNCLHGGPESFENKIWETSISELEDSISIQFSLTSLDGDNGFPGELKAVVTHTLTKDDLWKIDYTGTIDQLSIYNPTNHVYFNLNSELTEDVGNHYLMINADSFGVLNEELLPTGELRSVEETPFNFKNPQGRKISQVFNSDYEQNKLVDGLDHPFLLNSDTGSKLVVSSEDRNISIEMNTTAPSVVVYTTNMLENPVAMRDSFQVKHGGVTFETQELPDAINHDSFGSIEISPNKPFTSTTTFKINIKE